MIQVRNPAGEANEVKIGVNIYMEAEREKLSVPELLNRKYPTDSAKYGTAFEQLCASSGLLLGSDREFGMRSPSLADVFSGKAMMGGFDAVSNTQDADPASRILYPAAVIAMIEDRLRVDRETDPAFFDQMVGNDITVNNARFEQPVISYTKTEAARSKAISQLAEPARMLTITSSDTTRTIPTLSIGMEISDQALQATTLDLVGMTLQRYTEVERLAKAYEYLLTFLNGDTDLSQAALSQTKVDTFDATIVAAGTVTKKALVKWLWTNVYLRKINWIVTDLNGALAIETALSSNTYRPTYPIPGIVPAFSVVNRVFEKLNVFITDDNIGTWPANTLMGLDSRNAITRVRNVSAAFSAVEQFVLRRSSALRIDHGEIAYRTYDDAFDTLSLTLTAT